MKSRNGKYVEAEAFVRKALNQIEKTPVDDATIKAVAKKVSKAVPPYPVRKDEREAVAA